MATLDEGWDQSWGTADPATAAKEGRDAVSMYLSWDPSKNVTAAKVKAYHQHGIGVILNWESQAGAPLAGGAKGKTDATEAVRQAHALIVAVGYEPATRLTIYFSCDTDTSPSQYVMIDAYYRQARIVCHAAGFDVGVYGEADLVTHLHLENITDSEWQTYAWSRGVQSPDADFYQYKNGQKLGGADVDFDRIIHPAELGAWWPPGHEPSSGITLEDIVALDPNSADYKRLVADIANAVWQRDIIVGADKHKANAGAVLSNIHAVTNEDLAADKPVQS